MSFVVCFQDLFPKLGGLMTAEPVTAIKEGRILKVVLIVGVFAFCIF